MSNVSNFIDQLKGWGTRETGDQRTAMAELRRGLQEFPHLAPYMHRYIAPFTSYPKGKDRWKKQWKKQTYYLTAALFAQFHSGSQTAQYSSEKYINMGTYFHDAAKNSESKESIERRFNALLTAHPQDLHYHLRQAIAFLHSESKKGANIAINWEKMFWDIWDWNDDEKRPLIQEKWAANFWHHDYPTKKETEIKNQGE